MHVASLFAVFSSCALSVYAAGNPSPLAITSPALHSVNQPNAINIQWELASTSTNFTLADMQNLTVSLWYFPGGPGANYLLDVIGVVPATQQQVVAAVDPSLGPEGGQYRIYLNGTPGVYGFSLSRPFNLTGMTGTNASAIAKGTGVDGYAAANAARSAAGIKDAASAASPAAAVGGIALVAVLSVAAVLAHL